MTTKRYNKDWQTIFFDTLSRIDDPSLMNKFINDIMTEKEIREVSARLQAAMMLQEKEKYKEVITQTGLSSRTVARISSWLRQNNGGYSIVLPLVKKHNFHT